MQHAYKKILLLITLTSTVLLQASNDCCNVTTCFTPRSQSRDKVRQLVGTTDHVFLYETDLWLSMLSVLFEYTRSFRPQKIARCLFGCSLVDNCDCPTVKIQGSEVANRDSRAWFADYFYLPQNFDSTITFEPRISNFIVDLDVFLALDKWVRGLYLRLYGPITHTKWDLNFCECVNDAGDLAHPTGYFTPDKISRDKLLNKFSEYACGQSIETIGGGTVLDGSPASDRVVDTITFQPLTFLKIDPCKRTKTGFADLRMEFGWNFHQKDDNSSRFGLNIQAAAPTGGKKRSCYLFDALVGNGNHWEVGAGVTAHHIFWRNEDETKEFGFYFDGSMTHLFSAREQRTFDLCNKPNSRYMLAQKVGTPVEHVRGNKRNDDEATTSTAPSAQFKNEFAPVANLTTLDAQVYVPAQGDLTFMFDLTWNKWSFDFGYNFWGRSCEKFKCPEPCSSCCPSLCDESQENMWALKGDAHLFGFAATDLSSVILKDDPVAIPATQSNATICNGTSGSTAKANNANIDNPRFAIVTTNPTPSGTFLLTQPSGSDQIKLSLDPIFLHCDDLNFQATRGISHKIFAHVNYAWEYNNEWKFYTGIGGFAEFGKTESNCCKGCCDPCKTSVQTVCKTSCKTSCDPCCETCFDCALSQWGIWIKGGVVFSGEE